ncbi:MAG TPA: hypothetical protein VG965_02280 [Patescibacteria group bacterium]|nr:hypothetical protein [Patescibacteria group bacterium]
MVVEQKNTNSNDARPPTLTRIFELRGQGYLTDTELNAAHPLLDSTYNLARDGYLSPSEIVQVFKAHSLPTTDISTPTVIPQEEKAEKKLLLTDDERIMFDALHNSDGAGILYSRLPSLYGKRSRVFTTPIAHQALEGLRAKFPGNILTDNLVRGNSKSPLMVSWYEPEIPEIEEVEKPTHPPEINTKIRKKKPLDRQTHLIAPSAANRSIRPADAPLKQLDDDSKPDQTEGSNTRGVLGAILAGRHKKDRRRSYNMGYVGGSRKKATNVIIETDEEVLTPDPIQAAAATPSDPATFIPQPEPLVVAIPFIAEEAITPQPALPPEVVLQPEATIITQPDQVLAPSTLPEIAESPIIPSESQEVKLEKVDFILNDSRGPLKMGPGVDATGFTRVVLPPAGPRRENRQELNIIETLRVPENQAEDVALNRLINKVTESASPRMFGPQDIWKHYGGLGMPPYRFLDIIDTAATKLGLPGTRRYYKDQIPLLMRAIGAPVELLRTQNSNKVRERSKPEAQPRAPRVARPRSERPSSIPRVRSPRPEGGIPAQQAFNTPTESRPRLTPELTGIRLWQSRHPQETYSATSDINSYFRTQLNVDKTFEGRMILAARMAGVSPDAMDRLTQEQFLAIGTTLERLYDLKPPVQEEVKVDPMMNIPIPIGLFSPHPLVLELGYRKFTEPTTEPSKKGKDDGNTLLIYKVGVAPLDTPTTRKVEFVWANEKRKAPRTKADREAALEVKLRLTDERIMNIEKVLGTKATEAVMTAVASAADLKGYEIRIARSPIDFLKACGAPDEYLLLLKKDSSKAVNLVMEFLKTVAQPMWDSPSNPFDEGPGARLKTNIEIIKSAGVSLDGILRFMYLNYYQDVPEEYQNPAGKSDLLLQPTEVKIRERQPSHGGKKL